MAALSLRDLEGELERSMRRISPRKRPGKKGDMGAEDIERKMLLQSYMHKKKMQQARLEEDLQEDRLVDSALTNQVLLAELRGIQFEIDEYSRMRAERRRRQLSKSLPVPHSTSSSVGSGVGKIKSDLSESQLLSEVGSTAHVRDGNGRSTRSGIRGSAARVKKGNSLGSGGTTHSAASTPTSRSPKSTVSSSASSFKGRHAEDPKGKLFDAMESYYNSENEDLHRIVKNHFDRVGIRDIQRAGKTLAESREQTLMELRASLESRNRDMVQQLEDQLNECLAEDKRALEKEFDDKLQAEKLELKNKYSPRALHESLEEYRLHLDQAIAAKLAKHEAESRKEHQQRLEALSMGKLQEKEAALSQLARDLESEFQGVEATALQELDKALGEGARQAREALRQKLQAEKGAKEQAFRRKWAEQEEAQLSKLRQELETECDKRLKCLEEQENQKLLTAEQNLREEIEETVAKQIAMRTKQSKEKRAQHLSAVRSRLESKGEQELRDLRSTMERDLERAEQEMREQALERLGDALDNERQAFMQAMHRKLAVQEEKVAQLICQARQAYMSFRNEQTCANNDDDEEDDEYESNFEDDDDDEDEEEEEEEQQQGDALGVPQRISRDRKGEQAVQNFLMRVEKAHRAIAQKLRSCQEKLAEAGKEIVLVRKSTDLELSKSKAMHRKLLVANQNLSK